MKQSWGREVQECADQGEVKKGENYGPHDREEFAQLATERIDPNSQERSWVKWTTLVQGLRLNLQG